MLNHNYMINRNTEISENGITEILENIEPDTLETEISEISENETTQLQENIDPVYAHNVREVNQHIRYWLVFDHISLDKILNETSYSVCMYTKILWQAGAVMITASHNVENYHLKFRMMKL